MTETVTFVCSICGETSSEICVFCTKDACANHLCKRCRRCSDCCDCEVPLDHEHPEPEHAFHNYAHPAASEVNHEAAPEPPPQSEPDLSALFREETADAEPGEAKPAWHPEE